MRLDKLTVKAQEAVQAAQSLADQHDHQAIEPEHLLLALLQQQEGVVEPAARQARRAAGRRVGPGRRPRSTKLPKVQGGGRAYADAPLRGRDQSRVGRSASGSRTSTSRPSTCSSRIAQDEDRRRRRASCAANGRDAGGHLPALVEVRGTQRVTDQNPEEKYQALQRYARDLTELARKGKLDPVIGRDEEIRRVIQVLSRRTKNNPVLIGEPGVGKTAIVEGLAQRIVAGDVPEGLQEQARWSRSTSARMVAGAKYRGEFEDRLKAVLKEITESDGRDHLLHRRAAHAGRRGRGRGRGGRGQHAQAGPGPRRAALHRRHHARRVPQAHREGPGARAALPAGHGRRALGRGHDRHPARPEGASTRSTTR